MKISVESARLYRLKQGFWPFPPPVGYKGHKGQSHLLAIDEDVRIGIEFLHSLYATGDYNLDEVAKKTTEMGYGDYSNIVGKILKSKFYIGIMEYKGMEYPHRYPVFIDKEIKDICINILLNNDFSIANLEERGRRARKGTWSGKPIKGYKKFKDGIVIDKKKAQYIIDIFEEFCKEGGSAQKVIRYIWDKYDKRIRTCDILYILNNKFYIGFVKWGGALIEHVHPRIIDKELFDKAQTLIKERGHKKRDSKLLE